MKKLFILAFALVFTAVSCNSLFSGAAGSMGVFRSDDSGDSFHEVNAIDKKTSLNSTSVNNLIFDPANSQTLYMSSGPGIYKSIDSGDHWKLLLTNLLVADLALDPNDSNTIYAVGSSDNHGKVVKTTDGGGSWKDVYTEPSSGNTVTAVAIDPNNKLHILIGLITGEVIHSEDAGQTWQAYTNLHDQVYRIIYSPNKRPYILTKTGGLFESRNNSSQFTNLTGSLTSGYVNFDSNYSAVSRFLDIAFDQKQPNVIYLGTDVGLIRTVNDGANWAFMNMPVRNSLLRTAAVAVNPKDSNNLLAVVGSILFKSFNGGVTWETKPLPTTQEVRTMLIDGNSSNVVYLGLGARK